MLAHPSVLDRGAHRPDADHHDAFDHDGLVERVERCRAAARAWPPAERHFSLQLFDLSRLKTRLGSRWAEQRVRATAMIASGLDRSPNASDVRLDNGDARIFAVRAAGERREVERHGELLAAEVTARLCGTTPGGAIIRVATLPLDPDAALAGIASSAELLARLEALAYGAESGAPTLEATLPPDLQPRFRPILQLRKRLVSAYRLTAQTSDGRSAAALEAAFGEALDHWALRESIGLLRVPRRDREPALVIPVHYATLAGMRSRDPFAQRCRQLPNRSSRQLIFELQGLPEQLPQARVCELLGYLRPFSLALLVRLPHAAAQIGHLAGCGVQGISLAAGAAADASLDLEAMTILAGTARVAGMRSMLVDVSAPSLCRTAHAAGIDHVSGDALMPPLARPGRAFVVTRGG